MYNRIHWLSVCLFSAFDNGYVFSGRHKGSKDKKKRKTDGYFAREEKKRQSALTKLAIPANN